MITDFSDAMFHILQKLPLICPLPSPGYPPFSLHLPLVEPALIPRLPSLQTALPVEPSLLEVSPVAKVVREGIELSVAAVGPVT